MNKKYSTLLAMGLMMVGSLNVYADQLADYKGDEAKELKSGTKYILVQGTGDAQKALGFHFYDLETKKVTVKARGLNDNVTYKKYVWTAQETTSYTGQTTVVLTNAYYNLVLYVNKATGEIMTDYDDLGDADIAPKLTQYWAWDNGFQSLKNAKADADHDGDKSVYLIPALKLNDGVKDVLNFESPFNLVSQTIDKQIKLYEVGDGTASEGELNALYNTNGFNFDLTTTGVDNIFADQKVKAIKVDGGATTGTDNLNTVLNSENPKKGFPDGTYFAVSTPAGNYDEIPADPAYDQARIDYLLNCTFIAVSPTDNATSDANTRKVGKGFKLTTVSGKDLNLFIAENANVTNAYASSMTSGAEVSVWNAVFNVNKNYDGDKYALSLGKIRYQKATGSAKHEEAAVKLDIMTDLNYVSGKTLATVEAGASSFIFKFTEPVVEKASALLNQDGAAIYNIMFTSGYAYGSYLTDFDGKLYTKGQALADLDAPAFQYVITNVNGTNVTFTNRETGKKFTAKLYKENDGCYSLNVQVGAGTTYTDPSATILDLDKDNNVTSLYSPQNLNLSHVKLIPATSTDKFNGYWNVDSETLVTLAFARDFTPTSNKLYPEVYLSDDSYGIPTYDLFDSRMTDDVTSAAQWQLVKDNDTKVKYQTTTYAYLDANDKVVYKTKGDTVAVQPYKIQLIVDGNPVAGHYLKNTSGTIEIDPTPTKFYIKQNVDGSVTIETDLNSDSFLAASHYNDIINRDTWTSIDYQRYLAMEPIVTPSFGNPVRATNIKTYLIQDAPEISLPIETTFVTMQSEMGNYISMNEDQDGILVNIEPSTFKVFATDSAKAVPSFYVSFGKNEDGSRAYMFNPADSVNYYVGAGAYDKEYQWAEGVNKVIFKDAILNETADTLTTTVKGKLANVAAAADRQGTLAGLDKFKFQIVKADPEEDAYIIRQVGAGYVAAINGKLRLGAPRTEAVLLNIENTTAPTANAAIEAAGVQVIGGQGVVTVQGAAGKVVTVANILGQTIANQVAASDNVTIAVPAGIVVVAVDGEATKVVVK